MKNFLFVLVVLLFSLVITSCGLRMIPIGEIPLEGTSFTIKEVYSRIGTDHDSEFAPNQIICQTDLFSYPEGDEEKVYQNAITWSVWYWPSVKVSPSTKCWDTMKGPITSEILFERGFRIMGSGLEPFPEMDWLSQWAANHPQSLGKWCKSDFLAFQDSPNSWSSKKTKVFFDLEKAISSNSLVGSEVVCTDNFAETQKWGEYYPLEKNW